MYCQERGCQPQTFIFEVSLAGNPWPVQPKKIMAMHIMTSQVFLAMIV